MADGRRNGGGKVGSWRYPLRAIAQGWIDAIEVALRFRKPFEDDARECMKYVKGDVNLWGGISKGGKLVVSKGELGDMPAPSLRLTVNKAWEFKSIYGPLLYYDNPQFRVSARKSPEMPPEVLGDPNDPNVQAFWTAMNQQGHSLHQIASARAALCQHYVNYLPNEVGLKRESQLSIDQGLVAGWGILWPTLIEPLGSNMRLVGADWTDCLDVVADPDGGTIGGAYWWARRRVRPVWEVEAERGLMPGSLKGHYESAQSQGTQSKRQRAQTRMTGKSYDLIEYWEVYSRMGLGTRLKDKGVPAEVRQLCESFGDYCYLEVAEGTPFPLNLPTEALADLSEEELFLRAQWPIPYFLDDRPPFASLAYHQIPGDMYPTPALKPGLPELKFISWCMSHLAGKIRTTCRDFIAVAKSAGEELKTKILHGADLSLLEIERAHGNIREVVEFLQHPTFNRDIWDVLAAATQTFEQRVGLEEARYGLSSRQIRSATEAHSRQQQLSVRPDDMIRKTEDFMAELGRMWLMAARWHVGREDVEPILGPIAAHFWERLVMGASITEVTREVDLRVEAGSTTKPDFERDAGYMQQMASICLPQLMQHAREFGDYAAANNLLYDWSLVMRGEVVTIDPERYLIQPQPAMLAIESAEAEAQRQSDEKKGRQAKSAQAA